jgi:hypothetical protein
VRGARRADAGRYNCGMRVFAIIVLGLYLFDPAASVAAQDREVRALWVSRGNCQ